MKLHAIKLTVQPGPKATAQPYSGPLIVALLDIEVINQSPTMFVLVDESKTQTCENYVLRVDQPFDQPYDQTSMPTMLKSASGQAVFNTTAGHVIVASTCFGRGI